MPAKLTTTLSKIDSVPNKTNAAIITEYSRYLRSKGASEAHQNNSLKAVMAFARFLGPKATFFDVERKEQVQAFLDERINSPEKDPEKRWITTWNDYLHRAKMFYRWLFNVHKNPTEEKMQSEWTTPEFVRIKEKRTKRRSPYSENQIWEQHELLTVIKYEPRKRNKAALALFWDLDARNHEITQLRIKNIRFRENYGEGEIPIETKTGGGPIILASSFPYVRDWINEHPAKDDPEASLICNLYDGTAVRPESMWLMMKQLRSRIMKMLRNGAITDHEERQKLEYLLKTKKWNPYCLRHSAITADSDYLPEFALKKKVRWSMNSKQAARYIKNKMGDGLKAQILAHNGIVPGDNLKQKPVVLSCPSCNHVNSAETKYCGKCTYALTVQAYDEVKAGEKELVRAMEEKHKREMEALRRETADKLDKILNLVDVQKLVTLPT